MTFMTFVSAWAFGRPGSRTRSSGDAKNESMGKDRVVKVAAGGLRYRKVAIELGRTYSGSPTSTLVYNTVGEPD